MIDYFHILSHHEEDRQHIFCVQINPDCPVFIGHFPGEPIAPGVCNLQMILDCVQHVTGSIPTLRRISRCKFTSLIRPTDGELVIRLQLTEHKLSATIACGDHLRMQLSAEIA